MRKEYSLYALRKSTILIFLLPWMISCNGTPDKKKVDEPEIVSNESVISKPPSSYNDTLVISSSSAVFFKIDLLQQKKIKQAQDREIIESIMHDCFYQMRNGRMVLEKYWPQIKIIDATKARYLLFIKANKNIAFIDLNKQKDMCGLFIFDGDKMPELVDMTNIDTALGFYFN